MDNAMLWVSAIGTVVTSIFTALLWLVAWKTLGGAHEQLRLLRTQVEREARPYIAADVVPGFHGPGHWDLVVRNYGRTAARNVRFAFDEWEPKDGDDYITDSLKSYLHACHTLVPGARHRVMWRHDANSSTQRTGAGADGLTWLDVSYDDDNGKQYTDRLAVDVELLGAATPAPTEGPTRQGSGSELADINHAVRTLSMHIAELRR